MSSQEAAQALHHVLDWGSVAHHCPVVLWEARVMRKRGGKKRGEKVEVKEVHTIGVKVMKYMLRATPSHKEREKSRQQQRSLDFSEENDEEEPTNVSRPSTATLSRSYLAWARAIVKHRTELFQFSLVKHLLQLWGKDLGQSQSKKELASPQGMLALPQAENVGLSLSSQPLLLCFRPGPPPCRCCGTRSKTSEAVKQTPGWALDPLQAEDPPHLPSEDSNFSLLCSNFQSILRVYGISLVVPGPGGNACCHEILRPAPWICRRQDSHLPVPGRWSNGVVLWWEKLWTIFNSLTVYLKPVFYILIQD